MHAPALRRGVIDWPGHVAAERTSFRDPFVDRAMQICDRLFLALAVRHAAGQIGGDRDKAAAVLFRGALNANVIAVCPGHGSPPIACLYYSHGAYLVPSPFRIGSWS